MNTKPEAQRLDKLQPISLRLTDAEKRQARRLAQEEARSMANFARQMYLLGLRHYQQQQEAATA